MTRAEALALLDLLEVDTELAARAACILAPHVFGLAVTATKAPETGWVARKGYPRPPGYSVEIWMSVAKTIGTKRGRWWTVSSEQLAQHEGRGALTGATEKPGWSPATALRAAGVKGTR